MRMVCKAYSPVVIYEAEQIYNICSGRAYSLKEALALLGELTCHKIEVKVNQSLVRPNEVKRLCGEPEKLLKCVGSCPPIRLKHF